MSIPTSHHTARFRRGVIALALATTLPLMAACGTNSDDASTASSTTSSETTGSTTTTGGDSFTDAGPGGGAGPGGVDVSSVTTEDDVVALIQDAYGEGSLGLHRGHQPVEATLIETLGISHDEMHVRMEEQGQNLSAVAEDVGVGTDALVEALVAQYQVGIDNALDAGGITDAEATEYTQMLTDAFTWRVTWDGSEATPAVSAIDA